MNASTLLTDCETKAHETWRTRRSGPAYVRGLPSWMWTSALNCGPMRRRTPT